MQLDASAPYYIDLAMFEFLSDQDGGCKFDMIYDLKDA